MSSINGKEYAWADMQVVVSGKTTPLVAFQEHNYGSTQNHQPLHAAGRDPYSMTSGNKEYSGELVLLQSEFEAMQRALPAGKDVTDLRDVNITTAYLPEGPGQIVTDQCLDVRFTEVRKGMAQGDGNMVVRLPYVCLKVNFNV